MEHQIFIANRKRQAKSLHEEFGAVPIFDVTFAGQDPLFSTLSPMYPHGDLPVPFTTQLTANSLEAIWQGLKVFEHEGARLDEPRQRNIRCEILGDGRGGNAV